MRPPERQDSGQHDLLRSRLDQIIDLAHPLAKLARRIDWNFLEQRLGAAYTDRPGRPPLPTRLMAGLAIRKHMHGLSDEALCERWLGNPYYQLFCGEEFFRHTLPFDRSSMTRWRQRMGEDKLVALLQESLYLATRTGHFWEKEQTKAEVQVLIMDEVFTNLPTPPFTAEEKELIANNVYAHVWQQAMAGEFARAA